MLPASRLSSKCCSLTIRRRLIHSSPPPPLGRPSGLRRATAAVLGCGIVGGTLFIHSAIQAHPDDVATPPPVKRPTPLSALLRSYLVYTLCSFPWLVEHSPAVFAALTSVPGVRHATEAVVRLTFFAQFVGGDRAEDTVPLMTQLRRENKGVLLAYSVEVDQGEAERTAAEPATNANPASNAHKQNVDEIIKSIDIAASFEDGFSAKPSSGKKTWVAVKLTALLPSATSLLALSDYLRQTRPETSRHVPFPGCPHPSDLAFIESGAQPASTLSKADVDALRELYHDLNRIAERGQQRGVKLIMDAEYSCYQPAIDAFTLSLMRRFNVIPKRSDAEPQSEVQPLIYATYQAYLKRTPNHILTSIEDAMAGGYALGIKLVRGAYHSFEVGRDPSPETCPVWTAKEDTDACYNQCVRLLTSTLKADVAHQTPRLGILFGTHNSQSCAEILEGLVREGLAEERAGLIFLGDAAVRRCAIGQLFGMSDTLTNDLVESVRSSAPFVIKYVPYGPLLAVMPYLSRRAIENSSVLSGEGGAVAERRRVGREIRLRLFGM